MGIKTINNTTNENVANIFFAVYIYIRYNMRSNSCNDIMMSALGIIGAGSFFCNRAKMIMCNKNE